MATDDLSAQLALTQKLAAAVDAMAKSLSRVETSYETQVAAVEKLSRVLSQVNVEEATAGITNLSKVLEGLQGKFKGVGQSSTDSLDKMAKSIKTTDQAIALLPGRLGDFAAGFNKLGQGKPLASIISSMAGFDKKATGAQKTLGNLNKVFEKVPKNVLVAAAALDGFIAGLENIGAMGKATLGFFGGLVDSLVNVTASIVAIPFKMFDGLVNLAANASGMNELAQAIENLRKEMGDLKGPGSAAVLTTTKTLQGFSDTGLSAYRVFGTLAERLEAVTKVATAMGATFGVMRKEFEQNGGALLAFQKGLGVSEEGMKSIGDRAITLGKPMTKVFMDMTKQTLALGKAFDVDQKLIGKDMTKAMIDVHHFGAMTVKEIGQASVYARKLGVELDKITGTLDQFETFDSAAESASKLAQSFGVNVDAFKLMEAQSPAEQIDMLRKSFRDAGIDSSQFNRQQQKLLATTTGLDEATAKQVFSSKNYGVSLDDVKKKSEGAEKKTLTQAEAMSKLADSIERMVKSGSTMEGGFWKMFVKGVMGGVQSSQEFREIIMNIRKALMTTYQIGLQLGRVLPKIFPGMQEFLKGIKEFFDPAKFSALFKGISEEIKRLTEGKEGLPEFMDNLRKKFFNFFDSENPAGKKILDGFKKMFKFLAKIAAEGIKWAAAQVADGLRTIVDYIQHPEKLAALAKGGTGTAGFLAEVLGPLVIGIKDAAGVIAPALWELVKELGKQLWKYLTSDEFLGYLWDAAPYIAAALFGPALMRALMGAATTLLIKGAVMMFGKVLASSAIQTVVSAGGSAIGAVTAAAVTAALAAGIVADAYLIYKAYDELSTGLKERNQNMATAMRGVTEIASKGDREQLERVNLTLKGQLAEAKKNVGLWGSIWGDAQVENLEKLQRDAEAKLSIVNNSNLDQQQQLSQRLIDISKKQAEAEAKISELSAKKRTADEERVYQNMLAVSRGYLDQKKIDQDQLASIGKVGGDKAVKVVEEANQTIAERLKKRLDMTSKGAGAGDPKAFVANNNELIADVNKLKEAAGKINVEEINKQLARLNDIRFDALTSFTEHAQDVPKVLAILQATQESFTIIAGLPKAMSSVASINESSATATLKGIAVIGDALAAMQVRLNVISANAMAFVTAVSSSGIVPAVKAVEDMVVAVNQINDAIKNMPKVDVNARLAAASQTASQVATSVATQVQKVATIDAGTSSVRQATASINDISQQLDSLQKKASDISANASTFADSISKGGIAPALKAVEDMVKLINQMNDTLGNLPKADINAKLGAVAKAAGLGARGTWTIKNKDIVLNVNLSVSMNVDEVEKIMVMRKSSIIRDRLNFATAADTAGKPGQPSIPETLDKNLPNITKGSP